MSRAQDVTELAAHLHAATASVVDRIADFDASGEWKGDGFRDCAHWLTIHSGFGPWTAADMVRVGRALRELPLLRAAFADGRLSFDKVRSLVQVALQEDERVWLDVAVAASSTQLARICQAFRRAMVVDDPDRHARQQAARTFNAWWLHDGMLRLVATLPPMEGRVVLEAVENAVVNPPDPPETDDGPASGGRVEPAEYRARDTFGARRADALARVCERSLAGGSAEGRATRQLVVHVDVETLIDPSSDGRCHLEDGPAVAAALAARVGCDSEVLVALERGSTTLDLQRTRRAISGRLRRALQIRDGYCRYPGCYVSARDCDGHHVRAWIDQGLTELPNLISLCAFHHQRFHEGAFLIAAREHGVFDFLTPDARGIGPPAGRTLPPGFNGAGWLRQLSVLSGRRIDADTATATDRGEPFDLGLTIELLAGGPRASPQLST